MENGGEDLRDAGGAVSLLRPGRGSSGAESPGLRLSKAAAADLGLTELARHLALGPAEIPRVEKILLEPCQDEGEIEYRLDVLEDLLADAGLEQGLLDLLPKLASLERYEAAGTRRGLLFEVTRRMGELELYVECIRGMASILERPGLSLRSDGLSGIAAMVRDIRRQETFSRLVKELPELLSRLRGTVSITIGINLDRDLQPTEAVLLSINDRRFTTSSPSFFLRLFGREPGVRQWTGIAPLHRIWRDPAGEAVDGPPGPANPMLIPLFRDLSEVLQSVCRPIAAALRHYVDVNTRFLSSLSEELAFYLGAVRLFRKLRAAGLPLCRPRLAPREARACRIRDAYNLNLAVRFQEESGLAHLMAQAGLFIPGTDALLSPADAVYTHFPAEERPGRDSGRLGEEAERLHNIFSRATPRSLILLNEPLTSTSPEESLQMARDVVRALKFLGARAILTTHLHELAAESERLDAGTPGEAAILSATALTEEKDGTDVDGSSARGTFKIVPGPPAGKSYARRIALKYGITYEQLVEEIGRRGAAAPARGSPS